MITVDYMTDCGLTSNEVVLSAGMSNVPKNTLNGWHQMVMALRSDINRPSLGRLRSETVTFSPLNLLLGIIDSL